jgi:hypothetical protein
MLSYTEEGTFGNYGLAEKRLETIYSNSQTCKIKDFYPEPAVNT